MSDILMTSARVLGMNCSDPDSNIGANVYTNTRGDLRVYRRPPRRSVFVGRVVSFVRRSRADVIVPTTTIEECAL